MAAPSDDDDPWAPLPPAALWSDRAGEVVEGQRPPPPRTDWTPPPPLPRKPLPIGPTGGPPPREGYCATAWSPGEAASVAPASATASAGGTSAACAAAAAADEAPATTAVLRRGEGAAAAAPAAASTPVALLAGAAAEAADAGEVDPEAAAATSEWFQRLPPAEQERLRAQWQQRRARCGKRVLMQGSQRNRRFVAAVACSVATIFAGTGAYWHATIGAGVCCGLWWRHTRPDRFMDPLSAMACLFVAHLLAMWAAGGDGHPLAWVDLCVIAACAAVLGFDGEIRRTGGFDLK